MAVAGYGVEYTAPLENKQFIRLSSGYRHEFTKKIISITANPRHPMLAVFTGSHLKSFGGENAPRTPVLNVEEISILDLKRKRVFPCGANSYAGLKAPFDPWSKKGTYAVVSLAGPVTVIKYSDLAKCARKTNGYIRRLPARRIAKKFRTHSVGFVKWLTDHELEFWAGNKDNIYFFKYDVSRDDYRKIGEGKSRR